MKTVIILTAIVVFAYSVAKIVVLNRNRRKYPIYEELYSGGFVELERKN